MRIPNNVLAFAKEDIDVYKRFRDYFNHHRAVTENKTIPYATHNDKGEVISFEEKSLQMHQSLISEIEKKSGVSIKDMEPHLAMNHPTVRWATFAVINAMIDMILPETLIDSVGIYTDIKVGGFGESFAFDVEPRDLFTVTVAGKGKRRSELKKQFKGQVTILPVEHDITVYVSLYRVLAGQENLADFVLKAAKSVETQMTYDVYDAFNTTMTNLDSTGDDALKISGYSQATAVNLAQKVSAWNGGRKAVFIGTQVALANIIPANGNFRFMIDSDYVKLGYVRDFQGFDVMVLPQVADYTTPFKLKLDDTRIYVVSPSSQKLVKLCLEGNLLAIQDDVYANANLTQATTLKKNYGTGIATNSVAGLITLS